MSISLIMLQDESNSYFFNTCHTTSNFDKSNSSKMVDSFLFYTNNTKISLLEYFLSFLISTNVIAYLFFLLISQISRLSLYSKTKNISYKFYDFCIWNIQNKDLSLKFICIKSILFVPKNSNFSLRQVFELLNLFILP